MDARQFNVRDLSGRLLCPVCGYPGFSTATAYEEDRGLIGSCICPCCLWEPGFDDDPAASPSAKPTIIGSVRAYRANWIHTRAWQGKQSERPVHFDPVQLAILLELAPHLE
jgi:hypothetical protein